MIGVFDSGVGGLSVVKEIFKSLPNQKIIYFGDTARLPYGTKGADFVKKYSEKITEWLLGKGANVIVIACHTSSAQAGKYLKERFKNIPIFDMISPCLQELSHFNRIGVIGTPGTIKSRVWDAPNVVSKSCPLFVPLVEEGWIDKEITKEIVKEYLKDFNNIEALVLACTHYPMLEKIIKKITKAKIIDPAKIVTQKLKLFLDDESVVPGENQFFFSDEPYNLKKISKLCLGKEIKPIIYDPF